MVITALGISSKDLANSKSKYCNLFLCGSLIIKGIPFWETMVPHLIVLDLLSKCLAAINKQSHLLTSGMYRTLLISILSLVLSGSNECPIMFHCPLMVINLPSAISTFPGVLYSL